MPTSVSKYNSVVVLVVKDDLAGEEVEPFTLRATQSMDESGHDVVVDCSQMTALDSLALEALVNLQNKCEECLGAVKLCCLDKTCEKILDLTRLSRRFECFPDLDSAVRSFA
jgi:anti-anti-sigma factor